MVLQDVSIGKFVHGLDPVPCAGGRVGGTLPGLEVSNVGSGHIHSAETLTQDDEGKHHYRCNDKRGDQDGEQAGQRRRVVVVALFLVSM